MKKILILVSVLIFAAAFANASCGGGCGSCNTNTYGSIQTNSVDSDLKKTSYTIEHEDVELHSQKKIIVEHVKYKNYNVDERYEHKTYRTTYTPVRTVYVTKTTSAPRYEDVRTESTPCGAKKVSCSGVKSTYTNHVPYWGGYDEVKQCYTVPPANKLFYIKCP